MEYYQIMVINSIKAGMKLHLATLSLHSLLGDTEMHVPPPSPAPQQSPPNSTSHSLDGKGKSKLSECVKCLYHRVGDSRCRDSADTQYMIIQKISQNLKEKGNL